MLNYMHNLVYVKKRYTVGKTFSKSKKNDVEKKNRDRKKKINLFPDLFKTSLFRNFTKIIILVSL